VTVLLMPIPLDKTALDQADLPPGRRSFEARGQSSAGGRRTAAARVDRREGRRHAGIAKPKSKTNRDKNVAIVEAWSAAAAPKTVVIVRA